MKRSAKWAAVATILSLAWPTMLEQLMLTAVQYIDTAMVGTLGTEATAAVGATATVNWLISSTLSALGVGFLAFIARACGAHDRNGARKASSQALLVTILSGILFTGITVGISPVLPRWMQVDPKIQSLASLYFLIVYAPMLPRAASIILGTVLRAAGDTKTPMKVGVLVNILNVVGNFFLIFPTRAVTVFGFSFTLWGAGWGVVGAAAASAISYTWGGIHITIALWRHKLVSPKGGSLKPDRDLLRPCLKVAFPNMLQRFGTCLGYVAFASQINALGEVATAAHTIANTVESAFYIPGYGMQAAAATLVGNAYGARDPQRMRQLSRMFIPVEVALMVITGGTLFFTAPYLVDIFSNSWEVITLGTTVLQMVALSEPMYGVSIIVEGMMLGVGRTKTPFIYNLCGMWGVRILGTYLITTFFGGGLVAAWGCMIAHNGLLFVLYLVSFLRGSWNPLERNDKV